ncbi:M23 family metallopeptidase [Desulfovibrio mangrovi]|uniref:M23 family metallopeptidase n=1 Tax=Desulfovibrio mangrovi TaxID=2976983 RepID=UPI0022466DEC|nr:M23 family metallopeptidase [Desulfovibrio mangrovi]UZP68644.1 M23 family metallopeptidase [Desulfovibrio mangrovi]
MAVVLLVLLMCAGFGAGVACAEVNVVLPEHASPGQAFVAEVLSDAPLGDAFVEWNGKSVPVSMLKTDAAGTRWRGLALLGVPFGEKGDSMPLRLSTVSKAGYQTSEHHVKLVAKKYPEQHLTVDKKYVEVAKKDLDRHKAERERVVAALGRISPDSEWALPFLRPVPGGISSEYGLTRFFNEKPRNPHKGLDLRGAAGTPIRACADGVVVLAEQHFFAGNSVYVDHGQGVVSMYFHMSKIDAKVGQKVKRGTVIGMVGSTGRVTGPHLHFGIAVQGELVDPTPLLADS